MISIAIDGPSGAGKSSLAKQLAQTLGYVYVDTGAMYRAIGLFVLNHGKNPKNETEVVALLPEISIELRYQNGSQRVLLCGQDVSETIRTEAVGMAASGVSGYGAVRTFLLDLQRNMATTNNIIMDGRDIGTVILPDATLKIYLTASADARAQRRLKQLHGNGVEAEFETVLADIKQRDDQDMKRQVAPLKQARDAVLVDTSDLDFEGSFQLLHSLIKSRI